MVVVEWSLRFLGFWGVVSVSFHPSDDVVEAYAFRREVRVDAVVQQARGGPVCWGCGSNSARAGITSRTEVASLDYPTAVLATTVDLTRWYADAVNADPNTPIDDLRPRARTQNPGARRGA